jgi:hypothetical protein
MLFVPLAPSQRLTEQLDKTAMAISITHTAVGARHFYPTDRSAEASIHMSTYQTLKHS